MEDIIAKEIRIRGEKREIKDKSARFRPNRAKPQNREGNSKYKPVTVYLTGDQYDRLTESVQLLGFDSRSELIHSAISHLTKKVSHER